jgi:hypothetical protein
MAKVQHFIGFSKEIQKMFVVEFDSVCLIHNYFLFLWRGSEVVSVFTSRKYYNK